MQEKLKKYADLLCEWNEKINLVAPASLSDMENRHFLDSAQLADYVPKDSLVIDMGSGAGFPAVVLAIMGYKVVAIESIGKKAAFLSLLKTELDLPNFNVYNGRLESFIKDKNIDKKSKFIFTARAFAPLIKILDCIKPVGKTRLFLLKGRTVQQEIDDAKIKHKFSYKLYPSKTGDGFIVEIEV